MTTFLITAGNTRVAVGILPAERYDNNCLRLDAGQITYTAIVVVRVIRFSAKIDLSVYHRQYNNLYFDFPPQQISVFIFW